MMIQVWLIGVTGRQTVRCVLSTKSCAVTCFCFLAQDTKQKQFLGQKYPVEHNGFDQGTRDHNELDREPRTCGVESEGKKAKRVQMVVLIHSL